VAAAAKARGHARRQATARSERQQPAPHPASSALQVVVLLVGQAYWQECMAVLAGWLARAEWARCNQARRHEGWLRGRMRNVRLEERGEGRVGDACTHRRMGAVSLQPLVRHSNATTGPSALRGIRRCAFCQCSSAKVAGCHWQLATQGLSTVSTWHQAPSLPTMCRCKQTQQPRGRKPGGLRLTAQRFHTTQHTYKCTHTELQRPGMPRIAPLLSHTRSPFTPFDASTSPRVPLTHRPQK
jgi:hypothetical protein